jgi:mRNA interferase MazF
VRGDVHLLHAPRDARGHEQRGLRYAVVLQSDYLAELSTWLLAPTSTSALPLSFRPRIEVVEVSGQPEVQEARRRRQRRVGVRVPLRTLRQRHWLRQLVDLEAAIACDAWKMQNTAMARCG